MVRFDAYGATTTAANCYQLADLFEASEHGFTVQEGKGFHQFGRRLAFKDQSGTEVGAVLWGGNHEDRSMVEVKGEHTPRVVEALRSRFPHRVTRVDTCADFDAPGAFEGLLRAHKSIKRKHRIWGETRGDWEDHPEQGRTYYLGALKSPVRGRLYEKGRQPEYRHLSRDNWVRSEIQARPAKEAKEKFSTLSPLECWGASAWSRDLAAAILQAHVDPHPAGTTWRKSERDKALEWMVRQYGKHMVSLVGDLGGSWECLGLTLKEMITNQAEQ